ncbi:Protein unzipped [Sergentomyia squamirostris]
MRPLVYIAWVMGVVIGTLTVDTVATTKSVLTFKYISGQVGQLVTSSTLVWETFTGDAKQMEYAVKGGSYTREDETYPIHVCRALIDGIYTSGHTIKHQERTVCTVSQPTAIKTHHAFDILVNKGHGGKLTWRPWSKFGSGTPKGAVSASGGHVEDPYVARHRSKDHSEAEHEHHHMITGPDYDLGRFDPKERLGKIIVNQGDHEVEYNDGEILVETEPVRYELRQIKMDKWRKQVARNTTELASTVLANLEPMSNLVETVVTYDFDRVEYWGTHDGVARGLDTVVYETGRPPREINWGLKITEKVIETKTVSTILMPGTALNVTVRGNYTKIEGPYTATLVAYYADNDNAVSRTIRAVLQKAEMLDVKIEFSPVYWIHNQTVVPTTTTTSTTSTTTTTTTTTTPEATTTTSSSTNKNIPRGHADDFDNEIAAADESRDTEVIQMSKIAGSDRSSKDAQTTAGSTNKVHFLSTVIIALPLLLVKFGTCGIV